MAKLRLSFLRALKPRFCWFSRELDLTNLVAMLGLIALFLPILPWEGRKQGNYSWSENIHVIAEAANRELPDIESINYRYEKEIPDEAQRECVAARNVILTLVADDAVMTGEMRSVGLSNVPAIFLWDSVVNSLINSISQPNFGSVLVDVAKKCQEFPHAYLKVEEVENLKSKPQPRMGFWDYLQGEEAQEPD